MWFAAQVIDGVWPFKHLMTWLAHTWDEQKEALALTWQDTWHGMAPKLQELRGKKRIAFLRNASDDDGWKDRRCWAADGIHPNELGYQVSVIVRETHGGRGRASLSRITAPSGADGV